MKVPHVEVLAKHSGPESCGGYGNIAASGCTVGPGKRRRAIELRNHLNPGADLVA
jgi:hypothetical protein